MIDLFFSERFGRYQCLGPKRYRKTACELDKLPKVFIIHGHYDHLDEFSLTLLQKIHKPIFFIMGLTLKMFS